MSVCGSCGGGVVSTGLIPCLQHTRPGPSTGEGHRGAPKHGVLLTCHPSWLPSCRHQRRGRPFCNALSVRSRRDGARFHTTPGSPLRPPQTPTAHTPRSGRHGAASGRGGSAGSNARRPGIIHNHSPLVGGGLLSGGLGVLCGGGSVAHASPATTIEGPARAPGPERGADATTPPSAVRRRAPLTPRAPGPTPPPLVLPATHSFRA